MGATACVWRTDPRSCPFYNSSLWTNQSTPNFFVCGIKQFPNLVSDICEDSQEAAEIKAATAHQTWAAVRLVVSKQLDISSWLPIPGSLALVYLCIPGSLLPEEGLLRVLAYDLIPFLWTMASLMLTWSHKEYNDRADLWTWERNTEV
jgi:hypothetical protein